MPRWEAARLIHIVDGYLAPTAWRLTVVFQLQKHRNGVQTLCQTAGLSRSYTLQSHPKHLQCTQGLAHCRTVLSSSAGSKSSSAKASSQLDAALQALTQTV